MCDGSKPFLLHHFQLAHSHDLGRKGSQGSHQRISALSSHLLQGKGYNHPRCMKFYKKIYKIKTNLQIRGGRSGRGRRGGRRGRRGGGRSRGGGRGRRVGEDQNHPIATIDWNLQHLLLSHCGG